ncbi:MAG: AzlD domain-containing protein [Oscillospiraceae bacterium]|nr:AzlD domain-containing protein [Oscillospiraceae bacterium]
MTHYWICLAIMAGSTYLLRAVPFSLVRRKIQSPFIRSFLHYIPYAVLTAMTVPAIFYAVDAPLAAAAGFITALVLALLGKGLTSVALAACGAVYVTSLILPFF